jgi:proteic killer suppression protein
LEVSFDDADFAHTCRNERQLLKRHGLVRAKKIQQRLKALRAADTLADMRSLPRRRHELHGDRAGELSLDLDHPYRLLFRPTADPGPGSGGGLDWATVDAVTIIGIVDTHD